MNQAAELATAPINIARLAPDDTAALAGSNAAYTEHAAWLGLFRDVFRHEPTLLVASRNDQYAGHLALCTIKSRLFGRFVVSLPYLNSAGVTGADPEAARMLIDRAVDVATDADAQFLELRHEEALAHPALTESNSSKVHMRLALPSTADDLMASLKSKRRSQLRGGLKREFPVRWGDRELLDDFYAVFSRNMRDLGTPVYSRLLFERILAIRQFDAELCCLYDGTLPIAAALLIHREHSTEVPSASSLRRYHPSNANMAMYWHLQCRAIERGQAIFDFGRSTIDGPTYRFKKQWGARAEPAIWQYHRRYGSIDVGRPEGGRYDLAIRLWKRLPLPLANCLGPRIVRGIP